MIKICSLEFLNREYFETDIMLEDGRVLFKKGEKITPDMLLNLYFRPIYVEKWPLDTEEFLVCQPGHTIDLSHSTITKSTGPEAEKNLSIDLPTVADSAKDLNVSSQLTTDSVKNSLNTSSPILDNSIGKGPQAAPELVPDKIATEIVNEDLNEDLKFDEIEAKIVAEQSVQLGKILGMSADKLKELEKAAYYHKIGRSKFKTSDLKENGFERVQAEESYNILLYEMKVPQKIADSVRFYLKKYDTASFKLSKNNVSDIPYSHIIAITSYYNKLLSKNDSKERTLAKMLQLGGNRFNIFALHKFINMMRK